MANISVLLSSWKSPREVLVEERNNEPVLMLQLFPEGETVRQAMEHAKLVRIILVDRNIEHFRDTGHDGKDWLRISMRDHRHLVNHPVQFLRQALNGWSIEELRAAA